MAGSMGRTSGDVSEAPIREGRRAEHTNHFVIFRLLVGTCVQNVLKQPPLPMTIWQNRRTVGKDIADSQVMSSPILRD